MSYSPKKILSLSSTTTTKLVASAYHADDTNGSGIGYGRPGRQQIFIQVITSTGAMTGAKFEVQVARDPTTPVWIPILVVRAGDSTGTATQEPELDVTNGTAEDILFTENADGCPLLRVVSKAVGGDAGTGDSVTAWTWV